VLCQWNKDVRMCLPRSNPVPNICLNEQEDMYRTCFQRAKDPSNDLTQDTILRDEYNNGTIAPFTKPYVTSDEELTYETIYLSPVRDDDSTLDCYEKFRLEEISLMWLKVCVIVCKARMFSCHIDRSYMHYRTPQQRIVLEGLVHSS
jgi:hypothetical protein